MITVFMHAYPSEHEEAAELATLFRERGVSLVEMGHTHYNELANDGRTVYAATRSTGQIEEGPVGFSVTTLDAGVISWKFKPAIGMAAGRHHLSWRPAAHRGCGKSRASCARKSSGRCPYMGRRNRTCDDGYRWKSGAVAERHGWLHLGRGMGFDVHGDGPHVLSVTTTGAASQTTDSITILVNQRGPTRRLSVMPSTTKPRWASGLINTFWERSLDRTKMAATGPLDVSSNMPRDEHNSYMAHCRRCHRRRPFPSERLARGCLGVPGALILWWSSDFFRCHRRPPPSPKGWMSICS